MIFNFIFIISSLSLLSLSFSSDKPLVASFTLGLLLITLSYIDIKTGRLPNLLNLALFLTGSFYIYATDLDASQAIISVVLAVGLLGGISMLYTTIRTKKGLGAGDIKLFAAGAIWLAPHYLALCLLITSFSALMGVPLSHYIKSRSFADLKNIKTVKFALGPYLGFGLWISWLYGPKMMGL